MAMILDGLDIRIHKKNAAGFTIQFTGTDKPVDGTTVKFFVKESPLKQEIVIEKSLTVYESSIAINLSTSDTNIQVGTYYWNACIMYDNGDTPWTLMEHAARFDILPEIGYSNAG